MSEAPFPAAKPLAEASGPRALEDAFKALDENWASAKQPCVVRGAAADWEAVRAWTFASLAERLGPKEVPTIALRRRTLAVERKRGLPRALRQADHELREIEEGRGAHYLVVPVEQWPSELREQAPIPSALLKAEWVSSNLWVSPSGTTSPLHFDMPHNLLAQIRGRKRVLVFERGHFEAMYPEPPWSSAPNLSRVDPLAPDAKRFPRFRKAQPLTAELFPGDILYLPSATWHHVVSETSSISVNIWFANGIVAWLARAAARLKRLRGIR